MHGPIEAPTPPSNVEQKFLECAWWEDVGVV